MLFKDEMFLCIRLMKFVLFLSQTGRESDKAGRQLGVFMDLTTLDQNREEAKRMKEEVKHSRSGAEWAAYNKEKKNSKKRKVEAWVYDP